MATEHSLSAMGIVTNKLQHRFKLLSLHPGLLILMQNTVIFNTCHVVRKFLEEL